MDEDERQAIEEIRELEEWEAMLEEQTDDLPVQSHDDNGGAE